MRISSLFVHIQISQRHVRRDSKQQARSQRHIIARIGRAPEVMALKFADQLLSILHGVPEKIDSDVRWLALDAMGMAIDEMTKEQRWYQDSS
jgi:S-adenosylhomocysteine hydrolase